MANASYYADALCEQELHRNKSLPSEAVLTTEKKDSQQFVRTQQVTLVLRIQSPGSRARIRGTSTEYYEKYETLFFLCLSLH